MEDKKRKKDDKRKREASQKVSMFTVTCKHLHLGWASLNKHANSRTNHVIFVLSIFLALNFLIRNAFSAYLGLWGQIGLYCIHILQLYGCVYEQFTFTSNESNSITLMKELLLDVSISSTPIKPVHRSIWMCE